MSDPHGPGDPPSLLGITIRRAMVVGRLYLVIGTGMSLLYSSLLALTAGDAFGTAAPLLFPIFGAIGGMGAVLIFTNDRMKGVYEYLMAYGLAPRRLFANILVAALVQVTIVLGVSMTAGVAIFVARGHVITPLLAAMLLSYSVPMSYASAMFATTAGMFWTTISTPRAGMNSPLGLVPLIGIAPPGTVLLVVTALLTTGRPWYDGTIPAVVLMFAAVLLLLARVETLLPREQLLSPA